MANNTDPCVWLNRPWPVIVAKRKAAAAVSALTQSISASAAAVDQHWRGALAALLELRAAPIPLYPPRAPLDHLATARGFREAYSQSGCDPPRDYGLTAVLHEATPIVEKTHTVVAYIRKDAKLKKMTDLRGKRAVFPRFDGVAWHSVSQYFADKLNVPCEHFISFFGEICAPGIQEHNATAEIIDKLTKNCLKDDGNGELNALRSLIEGKSDVAFFSMKTYNKYKANIIHETWAQNIVDIIPICPEENPKYCFISWSNIGHIFVSKKNSQMRKQEIINVFTKLDQLFGKHQPFHSPMFSMYGQFNHQMDVLFHNNTKNLASNNMLKFNPYDRIPFNFERTLTDVKNDTCQTADLSPDSSFRSVPTISLSVVSLVVCLLYR
ncbi:Transferrin [Papilio machaon]|uniref:Transferrin n=1 Tax=Papilio machaon TaxID=76193 RepID=A0A0N1IPU2_PAPMA|nr:Transferrin [Papilio machaon]